jgi:nucleoside 2-deoxyribosyltransferase
MKVVGGTYRELVLDPASVDDVAGSGFRAAGALATESVSLATAVDEENAPTAAIGAHALGFHLDVEERSAPVEFQYQTPMSPPSLVGRGAKVGRAITTSDNAVLWFGMVESVEVSIETDLLVYDPQTTNDPDFEKFRAHPAKTKFLCANAQEIHSITGESELERACAIACEDANLSGVVVKRGASGCVAYSSSERRLHVVGSFPTNTVWKLGSGDVFSAGFFCATSNGADLAEAAQVASRSAAWWCGTRSPQVPSAILAGGSSPFQDVTELPPTDGTVYLAAPFFNPAERWLVNLCRNALIGMGVEVFSPFHDVGLGDLELAAMDLEGLDRSDAVLALTYHYDAGTLFEVGWATRVGLPVVALASNLGDHHLTMIAGTNAEIQTDLTTALYRAAWLSMGVK